MSEAHPLRRIVIELDRLKKSGSRLLVTVSPFKGEVMTFGSDNWIYMEELTDRLIDGGFVGSEDAPNCAIVVRRFDGPPAPGQRIPPKSVAGYLLTGNRVIALTAEEQRWANETDSNTGLPLGPEPLVTYIHGADMLPDLEVEAGAFKTLPNRSQRRQSQRRRSGRIR